MTLDPAFGVEAADRAVKLREICRSIALRHGLRASFAPVVTRGIVGNGIHIHLSLWDRDGKPATHDAGGPGGLSPVAAPFAAGVLRHARAICALTAAGVPSYERLKPQSWSAFYTDLDPQDREALLRICPLFGDASDTARKFNLEYRSADATVSPYLQLAAVVWAGLAGIRDGLPAPPITDTDPGTLADAKREAMGIRILPRSLGEALQALEADPAAMAWLGPTLSKPICCTSAAGSAWPRGRALTKSAGSTPRPIEESRLPYASTLADPTTALPFAAATGAACVTLAPA